MNYEKINYNYTIFLSISSVYAQCNDYQSSISDVQSYADETFSYAKKAYYADNLEDAQYYARKVKSSAEDCESEASSGESECD